MRLTLWLITICLLPLPSWGGSENATLKLGLESGQAQLHKSGFTSTAPWAINVGGSLFGWGVDYFYEKTGRVSSTTGLGGITLQGRGVRVSKGLEVNRYLSFYPAVGVYHWEATADLFSRPIGVDSGTTRLTQLSAQTRVMDNFATDLLYRRYENVSGVSLVYVGLAFSYLYQIGGQ
ncbi:MAG: hypothetical protein OEX00_09650 [Gammaproteobacteria bacterium]|nr:hypothetical protein [Gammaproteobacteria bacterium]